MTPFQKHSITSKAAAVALVSKEECISRMLDFFADAGKEGMTGDELNREFPSNVHRGTISARLIELEREGTIVKTSKTRLSRSKRKCSVYVLSEFSEGAKVVSTKPKRKTRDVVALENIASIFFTMIKNNQMPSGDSKMIVTPFDIVVLNKLAKRAKIPELKVSIGKSEQV